MICISVRAGRCVYIGHFNEAVRLFEMMRDTMATGHMGWAMGGGMVLLVLLLLLGAVALFKYIVFR